ncbi:MAG: leucine-rich repeat domain-containing protein, partial [Clostridia bacterium]|nr:leucine-rich repeat domain-containing protein [Clostridia bacterium]
APPTISIPNILTSIASSARFVCTGLTSITIPNSVTSIDSSAFNGCTNLQYNEFDNAYYLGNSDNPYFALIKAKSTGITSCTINENTKLIGSSAFQNCSGLTSVTIGDSVTSIGSYAFSGCSKLTSIEFNSTSGWYCTYSSSDWNNKTNGTYMSVTNTSTNATYFTDTYKSFYWYKK